MPDDGNEFALGDAQLQVFQYDVRLAFGHGVGFAQVTAFEDDGGR